VTVPCQTPSQPPPSVSRRQVFQIGPLPVASRLALVTMYSVPTSCGILAGCSHSRVKPLIWRLPSGYVHVPNDVSVQSGSDVNDIRVARASAVPASNKRLTVRPVIIASGSPFISLASCSTSDLKLLSWPNAHVTAPRLFHLLQNQPRLLPFTAALPTIQMHGVTHLVHRPRRCAPPCGASTSLSPLTVTLRSGSLLPKHRPTRGGRSCYRLSTAEQTSDSLAPSTLPPNAHLDKALGIEIICPSELLSSP